MTQPPPVTLVSAFFPVRSKFDPAAYRAWFGNTLRIRAPLVIFAPERELAHIVNARGDLPTRAVPTPLSRLSAWPQRDRFHTHPAHCPSPDLAVIWHSKVDLVRRAAREDPFGSTHYAWYDAGHCRYRDAPPPPDPWPHPDWVPRLPQGPVLVSTSRKRCRRRATLRGAYTHHVAGTDFLLHHSRAAAFCASYEEALVACLEAFSSRLFPSSDQCVHSYLHLHEPALYSIGAHGYGGVVPRLHAPWTPLSAQAGPIDRLGAALGLWELS